jgi:GDP-D-mannose dehydratase
MRHTRVLACDSPRAQAQEIGIDVHTGKTVIRVSEHFYRPAEVDLLIGNPQKAVKAFGFNPTKTPFKARRESCFAARAALQLNFRMPHPTHP